MEKGSVPYTLGVGSTWRTVGELVGFLWARKLWWMAPLVVVLVIIGFLLVTAQGSALAPFIYTIF